MWGWSRWWRLLWPFVQLSKGKVVGGGSVMAAFLCALFNGMGHYVPTAYFVFNPFIFITSLFIYFQSFFSFPIIYSNIYPMYVHKLISLLSIQTYLTINNFEWPIFSNKVERNRVLRSCVCYLVILCTWIDHPNISVRSYFGPRFVGACVILTLIMS